VCVEFTTYSTKEFLEMYVRTGACLGKAKLERTDGNASLLVILKFLLIDISPGICSCVL
jgi:hypothetical protein